MFELKEAERMIAKIKVIGVGGAGCNAVNSMLSPSIYGVEFIAVNTDIQHLEASLSPIKVQIGNELTKGLGAGSDPSIGRQAALEDKDSLTACIEGADMIFITAGMGGGTGTGASPVIAGIAKGLGILTVAVVTKPFFYEGRQRVLNAEDGIDELKKYVDSIIVLPNDNILKVVEQGTSMMKSFEIANDVLRQAIQGISDIILIPGYINLDFADVKAIMENAGTAVVGMGVCNGNNAVIEAVKKAISNPLLEDSLIAEAKKILVHIMGSSNLSLDDINTITTHIYDSVHDEAHIIMGTALNTEMEDEIKVTVIATGIDKIQQPKLVRPIKPWQPQKSNTFISPVDRILNKKISLPQKKDEIEKPIEQQDEQQEEIKAPDAEVTIPEKTMATTEDEYDIPTVLRKKSPSALNLS